MAGRFRDLLACPRCRGTLRWSDEGASCEACGTGYDLVRGVPALLPEPAAQPRLEERWYTGARGALPRSLVRVLEPHRDRLRPALTFKTTRGASLVREFAASFGPATTVVNVGAGETDYGQNVLNLELEPGPRVDVVGVAEALPFGDESVDGVILMAVLEHVADAERTLEEARRVLKPGGRLLVDVPFIQGYHASPADYRRYTEQGLRAELERRGFELERSGVAVGPGSAAAWIFSEFLALLLSGRSAGAYRVAKLLTTWIALPLKYADTWLERHPMAYVIPSAVWAIGRRRD